MKIEIYPGHLTDDTLAELATIKEIEGLKPEDIDDDLLDRLVNGDVINYQFNL